MGLSDGHMNIETPSIGTPGPVHGLIPLLIDDIIDPRYPNGAVLVLQRPGELGVVVTIQIPKGAMLCMIAPEQAEHVRPQVEAFKKAQQDAVRGNGAAGRTG